MARFPRLIDAAVLAAAASPHETHAMRIELKGVPSNVPYRLAGKGVQRYLLTYDPLSSAHILDVPASVWMADREALARDLLGGPHSSNLIVLTAPWNVRAEPEAEVEPIDPEDALRLAMENLDPQETQEETQEETSPEDPPAEETTDQP